LGNLRFVLAACLIGSLNDFVSGSAGRDGRGFP
jgi:hypothetical protein